jgi:hypothetical protein
MKFSWSEEDLAFRRERLTFLDETLPANWDEVSKDGPGGVAASRYTGAALRNDR